MKKILFCALSCLALLATTSASFAATQETVTSVTKNVTSNTSFDFAKADHRKKFLEEMVVSKNINDEAKKEKIISTCHNKTSEAEITRCAEDILSAK